MFPVEINLKREVVHIVTQLEFLHFSFPIHSTIKRKNMRNSVAEVVIDMQGNQFVAI